jgi:hypothetical protein
MVIVNRRTYEKSQLTCESREDVIKVASKEIENGNISEIKLNSPFISEVLSTVSNNSESG